MKKRITVRNSQGDVITGEHNVPNKLHFEIQQKNKSTMTKNKKAYTRKEKHKKPF